LNNFRLSNISQCP